MTLQEYLKGTIYYIAEGQMILCEKKDNNNSHILDVSSVRGWGEIQHLFKTSKEAEDFQDSLGEFITEAIKEKIKTLK